MPMKEERHRLLQQRSQILLEERPCQKQPEICERPFQVLLEEKLSILEPSSQYSLVACL